MHCIMSFVACTGVLMKISGILSWLENVFRGLEKIITGKKSPTNVKALRFAMLELLRN